MGYLWPVRIYPRHIADDHAAGIYALTTDGTTVSSVASQDTALEDAVVAAVLKAIGKT